VGRPDSIATALRTAVVFTIVPAALIGLSAAAIVMALCGASSDRVNRCYLAIARIALRVSGTTLEVRGAEHAAANPAYVVVANHESNWDPFSIIAGVPDVVLRFVVKRELISIPVFGHALRLTGNITVNRSSNTSDVKQIVDTMSTRDPRVSMLFFAEGTRSRDGSYQAFKMGAFATAIEAALPILPIGISGARRILLPHSIWLRTGRVVVEIGAPITVAGLSLADRASLRDQTHEAVGKLRGQARDRLRALGQEPGGID